MSLIAGSGSAQFLRVGPFDFAAQVHADAVYTTNVERERESEAEAEREDIFFILALDMPGRAAISPKTTLDLDTGVAVEKHVNRPDLDNSSNPFGRIYLRSMTEISHLKLQTHAGVERTSVSATDTSFPGASDKTRRESTRTEYGAGLEWERDRVSMGYAYDFSNERFAKEQDQVGDQDETQLTFDLQVQLAEDLRASYEHKKSRTELVNVPNAPSEWLTTESLDLGWSVQFWRYPRTTYSIGMEKEDTEEQKGEWQFRHAINVEDEYAFSRSLRLTYGATYEMEDQREDTDITLTYRATLEHELGRTAMHAFTISREPVDTFGSTKDTDRTEYTYLLRKRDLLIYGLNLDANVTRSIDKPLDEALPEEDTLGYELSLSHAITLTRRLTRSLMYTYNWEDSNLQDEILDEHRITLRYTYDL